VAQGIRNTATLLDKGPSVRPTRPARAIGVDGVVTSYNPRAAQGAACARNLNDGRYAKVPSTLLAGPTGEALTQWRSMRTNGRRGARQETYIMHFELTAAPLETSDMSSASAVLITQPGVKGGASTTDAVAAVMPEAPKVDPAVARGRMLSAEHGITVLLTSGHLVALRNGVASTKAEWTVGVRHLRQVIESRHGTVLSLLTHPGVADKVGIVRLIGGNVEELKARDCGCPSPYAALQRQLTMPA